MDKSERSNCLFNLAYMNAMGDATRRTNVVAGFKKDALDTKNNSCSQKAKDSIRKYIDETLKGNTSSFDQTALFVVEQLKTINYKNTNFDFGNAQKLINMTAKYLFTRLYDSDDIDLRNSFSQFHCPMDRIMIGTVTKKYKEYLKSIPNKKEKEEMAKKLNIFVDTNGKPCINGGGISISNWSSVSWRDLNQDTKYIYDKYQEMVKILANKEGLLPIEFDLKYWEQ